MAFNIARGVIVDEIDDQVLDASIIQTTLAWWYGFRCITQIDEQQIYHMYSQAFSQLLWSCIIHVFGLLLVCKWPQISVVLSSFVYLRIVVSIAEI